jgi:hypothetical protein
VWHVWLIGPFSMQTSNCRSSADQRSSPVPLNPRLSCDVEAKQIDGIPRLNLAFASIETTSINVDLWARERNIGWSISPLQDVSGSAMGWTSRHALRNADFQTGDRFSKVPLPIFVLCTVMCKLELYTLATYADGGQVSPSRNGAARPLVFPCRAARSRRHRT